MNIFNSIENVTREVENFLVKNGYDEVRCIAHNDTFEITIDNKNTLNFKSVEIIVKSDFTMRIYSNIFLDIEFLQGILKIIKGGNEE